MHSKKLHGLMDRAEGTLLRKVSVSLQPDRRVLPPVRRCAAVRPESPAASLQGEPSWRPWYRRSGDLEWPAPGAVPAASGRLDGASAD